MKPEKDSADKNMGVENSSKVQPVRMSRFVLCVILLGFGVPPAGLLLTGLYVQYEKSVKYTINDPSYFSQPENETIEIERPKLSPVEAELQEPTLVEKDNSTAISRLNKGISIMTKEVIEVERDMVQLSKTFYLRPRPRSKPWSAAEILDEANIYLKTYRLTPTQKLYTTDAIRSANTTITNANIRIKELKNQQESLKNRITKAQEKIKELE